MQNFSAEFSRINGKGPFLVSPDGLPAIGSIALVVSAGEIALIPMQANDQQATSVGLYALKPLDAIALANALLRAADEATANPIAPASQPAPAAVAGVARTSRKGYKFVK